MEKGKSAAKEIASALKSLQLEHARKPTASPPTIHPRCLVSFPNLHVRSKKKPQRLVSLCIGVLGEHFEDIIAEISEVASGFPSDIKLTLLAIARRRQLLNDHVLVALAEKSWDFLDISGSEITDFGLSTAAQICTNLRAVDISRCDKITATGVTALLHNCRTLETLRCGGCPRSDFTARRCLSILKPKLDDLEGESWEELEDIDIGHGAQSLRWLVWGTFFVMHPALTDNLSHFPLQPKIDEDSKISLATECPRISINPKAPHVGLRGVQAPVEALAFLPLDHAIVEGIDPKTWAASGAAHFRKVSPDASIREETLEIPIAEKFRLAFLERDLRLAPKRAKNARQHRRRAEREWLMSSNSAKSVALASQAGKFLPNSSRG
ncbi:hypothetical protein AXF42_Ash008006 [Apostasia shenzhenica]|uniref:F-box protein n=1 Tax=Apostasia shenzhenica TaxID=1088818 RepID=A0A2I0A8B3_9ASPA|nr:hypothetical protein AXF42_Ash008006 [Apostasia shenzhenica]